MGSSPFSRSGHDTSCPYKRRPALSPDLLPLHMVIAYPILDTTRQSLYTVSNSAKVMIMPGPKTSDDRRETEQRALWRGVDFSGATRVLGGGTGRLIELLAEQVALSSGALAVLAYKSDQLLALTPLRERGLVTLMQARTRHLPVLSETVDLVVVNGSLREVPSDRYEVLFNEVWRALTPGGRLRISEIIQPAPAPYNRPWTIRNVIVRKIAEALGRPTALAVDLHNAAQALRSAGFENINLALLAGYALTQDWLDETIDATRAMASRLADRRLRQEVIEHDLEQLVEAFSQGDQRAAERFVIAASKVGDLALTMEADLTEDDLFDQV